MRACRASRATIVGNRRMTDSSHNRRRATLPKGVRAAARNLGWLLGTRGVIAVLSLLYLGIATRTLGVVNFGRFALINGAVQAIFTFVAFQTWQIVVRYGVDHILAEDDAALARLLRGCLVLDAVSALIGSGIAVAVLEIGRDRLGITPDMMRLTLLYAVVQLVTIRSTAVGILRLRDKFSLAAIADSMQPIMRFIGCAAAAFLMPTVTGFLMAWGAAEIVTAGTYWLMITHTGDMALIARGRFDRRQLMRENPNLSRFVLSTNATSTLGLSSKQVPLLLVGAYVGTAAAGAFRLAFQIAQALTKLSQLLSRAAFPEIVRAVRSPAARNLPRMLTRVFLYSAAAAAVILALVAAAGHPILQLVGGDQFRYGRTVMMWMAAAGCLDLAVVSFEPVLMAAHRSGTALAARTIASIVLVGATVFLLPRVGTAGAGMGMMAGSLTAAVLLGWAVIRFARGAGDKNITGDRTE